MSEPYTRTGKKTSLFGLQVHGPVFFTSAALILIAIVLTLIYRESAAELFSFIQSEVSSATGWFFILSVNIFLVFVLYLAFSKFGRFRLGGEDAIRSFLLSHGFQCCLAREWELDYCSGVLRSP